MNSKNQRESEMEIIDHKIENDTRYFHVKLKSKDQYKWIPLNIRRKFNENLILEYYVKRNIKVKSLPPISKIKRAKALFELLSEVSEDELNMFVRKYTNFSLPPSNFNALMNEMTRLIPDEHEIRLNGSQMANLRTKVLIEVCHRKRLRQQQILKEKEWLFNRISDNTEPILIQNNIDFATIAAFVKYVNSYVPGTGIQISSLPPDDFGCGRDSNNEKKHGCNRRCPCMKHFDAEPAYDKNGRVCLSQGERIQECNRMCGCDSNCRFRVVQKGCTLKMLIFRCSNGAGWGVKTREFIPRGTFIGKYVGKVVRWEEAEQLTSTDGRNNYLFDIDFITDENGRSKYTVDAYEYGNFTRFINHSCAPNLNVYHVFANTLDEHLHDIAFFAARSIECGEELTFNYRKLIDHCKCGSYKCTRIKN